MRLIILALGAALLLATTAFGAQTPGLLVWSNYSNGNWDLYLKDETGKIKRLTKTPGNESFPRFSPDGRWIYYTVTEEKRKSIRRINLETGDTDGWKIENAEYSNFLSGSELIYSVYKKKESRWMIERMNLKTGARTLHPVNYLSRFASKSLYQPVSAVKNKVTFVLVNRLGWRIERAPGIGEVVSVVGGGCRPSSSPDGQWVAYVSNRGHGGTSIMAHNAVTGASKTVVDMPGDWSREYDPSFSNDGRWLVFSSGPSKDWKFKTSSDYKIFRCRWDDCKSPKILVDLPGADGFPDLYFKR